MYIYLYKSIYKSDRRTGGQACWRESGGSLSCCRSVPWWAFVLLQPHPHPFPRPPTPELRSSPRQHTPLPWPCSYCPTLTGHPFAQTIPTDFNERSKRPKNVWPVKVCKSFLLFVFSWESVCENCCSIVITCITLEKEWPVQSQRSSEWSHCSIALRGANWGGPASSVTQHGQRRKWSFRVNTGSSEHLKCIWQIRRNMI